MMKFKSLIVSLFIFAIPVVAQEPSDFENYGDCGTVTISDPMMDEAGAVVFCGFEAPSIAFIRAPGRAVMHIEIETEVTKRVGDGYSITELQQFADSEIKFRVDRGEIHVGSGRFQKAGFFSINDNSFALKVIFEIPNGQKLHFSIDDMPTETIMLQGAKEAVEDMKRRLEAAP